MSRPAADVDHDIDSFESDIAKLREKIAALRKDRAPEFVEDYEVTTSNGARVRLSALFGGKRDLVLVQNIGTRAALSVMRRSA